MARICIFPRVQGSGGMASFRIKMERGLRERNIDITHDLSQPAEAILLIAGTRHILPLWSARRRGLPIVQRLDGLNWVQRARWSGLRYHLRAEYGNAVMRFLRRRVANTVVYQSQFIRRWWHDWYGPARVPSHVILNGVDLREFSPQEAAQPVSDHWRLLVLEGSLAGGQSTGLFHALHLAERLSTSHPVELMVAGQVDRRTQLQARRLSRLPVQFLGVISRDRIPALIRSAHLLFSAEVNPPCPNSVIEALACGLPVVGFETGSLPELVAGEAGRLVPYAGDPWKLDPPDIPSLAAAALTILADLPRFRRAARARAESLLGMDTMVDEYVRLLLEQ